MKRIKINQLDRLKDLPKRESIKGDPDRWHYHGSYTNPFWRIFNQAKAIAISSNGKHVNEVVAKVKRLSSMEVTHSEVCDYLFDLPDRNGEYLHRWCKDNGWGGFRRGSRELKVGSDGIIQVRSYKQRIFETVAEWRKHRTLLLQKQRARSLSRKRQRVRDKRLAKTGCGSMHKQDLKVKGYTKAERFQHMLSSNPLSTLMKYGIITLNEAQQKMWDNQSGLRSMSALQALALLEHSERNF